ncbi:hypothetical protein Tco_1363710, partial [Tanacetum coccineum]
FPNLRNINVPTLSEDVKDQVVWMNMKGDKKDYSTGIVSKDFWSAYDVVPWYKVVWFSHYIPKHAFIMWLCEFSRKVWEVMKKKCDVEYLPNNWKQVVKIRSKIQYKLHKAVMIRGVWVKKVGWYRDGWALMYGMMLVVDVDDAFSWMLVLWVYYEDEAVVNLQNYLH